MKQSEKEKSGLTSADKGLLFHFYEINHHFCNITCFSDAIRRREEKQFEKEIKNRLKVIEYLV